MTKKNICNDINWAKEILRVTTYELGYTAEDFSIHNYDLKKAFKNISKGNINKYFALWSVTLAGRFHEEGGFSQPSNEEALTMFTIVKKGYAKKKPWAYLKSWDWYNEYLYSVKVRFY